MATTSETKVDRQYLIDFRTLIDGLLKELSAFQFPQVVEGQHTLPVLNASLTVVAGSDSFDLAASIKAAMKAVGGSISAQCDWLRKFFEDFRSELDITINTFTDTETLNQDAVDLFRSLFAKTIKDMGTPSGTPTPPPVQ